MRQTLVVVFRLSRRCNQRYSSFKANSPQRLVFWRMRASPVCNVNSSMLNGAPETCSGAGEGFRRAWIGVWEWIGDDAAGPPNPNGNKRCPVVRFCPRQTVDGKWESRTYRTQWLAVNVVSMHAEENRSIDSPVLCILRASFDPCCPLRSAAR